MNSLLINMTLRLFKGPRGRESRPIFGSILGIALSMVPLVVVLFLSDGMIKGITARYIETGTFHIQLRPYESFTAEEWKSTQSRLAQSGSILSVQREHSGMGLAFAGDRQSAVSIRSVSPGLYADDHSFQDYIEVQKGEFDLSEKNHIVLGRETASLLNLQVGDPVKLMTGKTLSTGKYIPKVSTFTVKAIFSTGYQELDKLWVFIPLEKGLRILQDNESGSRLLIKVEDPYQDLSTHIKSIRDTLGNSRWGIYSWQSLNRSQQSNYETTKLMLILIMALIVLVAVMNISSSMIMLVMENEQDIGILKSMGMDNRFLSLQYVLTAGLAGGTGSIIGLSIGALIARQFNGIINIINSLINSILDGYYSLFHRVSPGEISLLNQEYYLEDFTIHLDFGILSLIFLLTVILSMVAALFPLRNIGKITPLDILRKH